MSVVRGLARDGSHAMPAAAHVLLIPLCRLMHENRGTLLVNTALLSYTAMPAINEPLRSPPLPVSQRGLGRLTDAGQKLKPGVYHAEVEKQENLDILYLMLAFRFINALLVQTFFQPDEYFQSLEPAWRMAFGASSGAWITWVSA